MTSTCPPPAARTTPQAARSACARASVVCLENAFSQSRVWRACGEQRCSGRGVSPKTMRFEVPTRMVQHDPGVPPRLHLWLAVPWTGWSAGWRSTWGSRISPLAQASSRPAERHQQPSHAAARYTPGPIQLLRRSLVVRVGAVRGPIVEAAHSPYHIQTSLPSAAAVCWPLPLPLQPS
jgi:hypothetical protein